ncbi:MAG: hypothetical protein GXO89_09375 [Chlorobi bacterium]|nr:hypothetical protein [Chlorobiota bacterium]
MNETNNNPSMAIAKGHHKKVIAKNPKVCIALSPIVNAKNQRAGIWQRGSVAIRSWFGLPLIVGRLPRYSLPRPFLLMLRNDVRYYNWAHKPIILSLILFVFSSNLFSQNTKPDFNTVDHQTYRFYFLENWDSLIITGEKALKQDIDYFYLRMRLGRAYYEKDNFSKSAQHFEKALEYSATNATALEYLYYSYLFTNRELDAKLLTKQFPESLNKKINPPKNKAIDEIYLETGPTSSNNISLNKKDNLMGKDSIYGEHDLNDNKYYFHLGLKKNIGKRASVYVGYSKLSISKLKQIQVSELVKSGYDTIPYNGWYYVDTLYSKVYDRFDHNYKLYQNELYLNANIALGNGFLLVPAAHLVQVQYNELHTHVDEVEFYAQSYDTVPTTKYVPRFHRIDTSFVNYVGWMALYKNISNYRFGLMGSYSDLNGKTQVQVGAEMVWFPQGNLDLYSVTNLTMAIEDGRKRPVLKQKVGSHLSDKLWGEALFSLGSMINYTESNAFVVHNSGDKINFSIGANLILSLSSKIEVSVRYQYFAQSTYWYKLFNDGTIANTTINYQNHQLIGGLKWKL